MSPSNPCCVTLTDPLPCNIYSTTSRLTDVISISSTAFIVQIGHAFSNNKHIYSIVLYSVISSSIPLCLFILWGHYRPDFLNLIFQFLFPGQLHSYWFHYANVVCGRKSCHGLTKLLIITHSFLIVKKDHVVSATEQLEPVLHFNMSLS